MRLFGDIIPVFCLLGGAAAATATNIWPIPETVNTGDNPVWLHPQVALDLQLPQTPASYGDGDVVHKAITTQRIEDAWKRTKEYLFQSNIVPWKFHKKGSKYEPDFASDGVITKVVVIQKSWDRIRVSYNEMDDKYESYSISVPDSKGFHLTSIPESGQSPQSSTIYIEAENYLGILHAFTTLSQLFYAAASPSAFGNAYAPSAPIFIADKPKFKHRGFNLDVSRQWYPMGVIKRLIDALSWNKFNRLHLHITDSQSWPLEIPSLPELAEKGAYAPGLTYSPEAIQDLLRFAEDRGVEVILEIDMPGHTTSIAEAYPKLIVGKNKQDNWKKWAAQPPSGSLKLNNPAVEDFLTTLFDDLLPRLSAHSRYFHTGGDEVNLNVYALDPGVNSNTREGIRPHLQKFFNHVQNQVKKHQGDAIVWEEMSYPWELDMPKDTIVQSWQSDDAVRNATAKGHRVIAGNNKFWYLDCGHGQWLDFKQGADFQGWYPFADYCAPLKNWREMYTYSPTQNLTPEQAALVIGAEVHVWSEQIDGSSIDIISWPRASAAGEVLWSGRTDAQGLNRTFEDATQRLGVFRERMVRRGVAASPITQLWCHQNEGDCMYPGA